MPWEAWALLGAIAFSALVNFVSGAFGVRRTYGLWDCAWASLDLIILSWLVLRLVELR